MSEILGLSLKKVKLTNHLEFIQANTCSWTSEVVGILHLKDGILPIGDGFLAGADFEEMLKSAVHKVMYCAISTGAKNYRHMPLFPPVYIPIPSERLIPYPPSGNVLYDYLIPSGGIDRLNLMYKYASFLSALFSYTAETLKSKPFDGEMYPTPEALALAWKQHLAADKTVTAVGSFRSSFYAEVVRRSKQYLDVIAYTLAEGKARAFGSLPSNALDIYNSVLGWLVEYPFFTICLFLSQRIYLPHYVSRRDPFNAPFTELPFDVFARDVGYLRALGGGRIFLEDMHSQDHYVENYADIFWVCDELSAGQTATEKITSMEMEAKLVRSRLKIPLIIPQEGQCMIAGYPSEPLLVEAALQLLPGDLPCSRLPLGYMVAHDHPVPVLVLLDAMFNRNWRDTILSIRPVGDENGPPLREAFKNVYQGLPVPAPYDASIPDFRLLYEHYRLHHCDASWFSPSLSDISTSQLAFLIQNSAEEVSVLVEPQTVTPVRKSLPMLSLLMQLGVEDRSKHRVESFNLIELGAHTKSIHGKHYQINAVGCSPEVFSVIPIEQECIYQRLLRPTSFMDDSAGKHAAANLSAIRIQKRALFSDKVESWSCLQDGMKNEDDIKKALVM
ncbi:hypothetical protein DFS33DRAFT_1452198 [Desarmillaria ectypa]|nr:hypothetical protein DFS33DRAFT_1452198 [Desarmillaria ectypa]